MSRLPDEQWDMIEDSIEKKHIANSAHNKRSHCGKGGSIKLPSDYLSTKELKAMNGEVKSYHINEPVMWSEFKKFPNDIQIMYVNHLREKYNVTNNALAKAMGISNAAFNKRIKELGLNLGKKTCGRNRMWSTSEEAKEFWKWWGVDTTEETNLEENNDEIQNFEDECCNSISNTKSILNTTNVSHISYYDNYEPFRVSHSVPENGNLMFECNADAALNTLKDILCNSKVHLDVSWIVIEED